MPESIQEHHPARWWETTDDGRILCRLCPRECRIVEGKPGFCYVRQNLGGELVTVAYGHPSAVHIDPIEKKPLNHFLPGTAILSMGTAGCNLGCKFCQNWDLSKARELHDDAMDWSPESVVRTCVERGIPSMAYTYNDPTIWAEYVIDLAKEGHRHGIRSVMVTSGYISEEPFHEVYQHIDAANVDLKGFTEEFYRKVTISHLEPVLNTLKRLRYDTDVWFEITTLLIPGLNDGDEDIKRQCQWILENLGDGVPLHFTAFHPDYKMLDRPRTPAATLTRARQLALNLGLKFVYVGNVHDADGQTTYCPSCGEALLQRDWHTVYANKLVNGCCHRCGEKIPGRWA